MKKEYLELKSGYRTALIDGTLVPDSPKHMATEAFYHAMQGDRLQLEVGGYLFAVAIFELERDPQYIYSYCYQREENWTTYSQNLTPQSYQSGEYVFEEECYFRVCVRRQDDANICAEDLARKDLVISHVSGEKVNQVKAFFQDEVEDTVMQLKKHGMKEKLKLCLIADTHYTVNGTWEDTANNIYSVAKQVAYDGIVHLGDFTDGMVSKEQTAKYVKKIQDDLEKCGVPVYSVVGNHDSNYFRNHGREFTSQEMRELYKLPGESLDYYVDILQYSVRMIFLSSFDDKAIVRYGYTDQQLEWFREVLYSAPKGTRFLIFSHDAPLAKLDYWSYLIRNGEAILDILEECNDSRDYQVLGFIFGHVHADIDFRECSFPVVSVGCAKLEYFTDKKPKGAITYERIAGTVTQDLWDSLLVDFEEQVLRFVRFGAGEDRVISYAKKESAWKKTLHDTREKRIMKVWAHRGASAHAPENTMPAFQLANILQADGIELDVQLTRDGVPVVIHDERVDRVSDGTGWVKDYTLDEIRRLNVGVHFPAYGRVEIPTLKEVYDYVKTTDMLVNVELKNNVIHYEMLEEKILALAECAGIEDRIIYSSFNHQSLKRIKDLKPGTKIAFLYSDGFMDMDEYGERHGAYAIHPSLNNVQNTSIVDACHAKGMKVHVWTVNEEVDFERMREVNVDAVITNYVERG